jgi:hypothetical protein
MSSQKGERGMRQLGTVVLEGCVKVLERMQMSRRHLNRAAYRDRLEVLEKVIGKTSSEKLEMPDLDYRAGDVPQPPGVLGDDR